MNDVAAKVGGARPEHYDRELGPRLFFGYANDLAARFQRGHLFVVDDDSHAAF